MGRKKSGWERIVGGIIALVVFGFVGVEHLLPTTVAVVLGVLFGLVPILGGTRRLVSGAIEARQTKRQALDDRRTREQASRDSIEKTILKIAQDRRGVVTPALVVLGSDLKLEEAEKALSSMTARGYAEMRIKDNGTIDYVFHELG